MLDTDTFITTLYVMVDDFCKRAFPSERGPGRKASLTRSEVITLALFSQWRCFGSERDFYRWALRHLRAAFPKLPDRAQFNRLARQHQAATVAFFLHLVPRLEAPSCAYEVLDTTAVPVRERQRRGEGWLEKVADIGWSRRYGWFEGFTLLVASNPTGVITGYGVGQASTKEQPLTEVFLAARHTPHPRLPFVGAPARVPYVTDKGFEGQEAHRRWKERYQAVVISPPKKQNRVQWPQAVQRWWAGLRQMIETVNDKLQHAFRLGADRPHALDGILARIAAKVALHDFCIWCNRQLGRPDLAFVDLVAW
jgi:hypothetical protein